MYLLKLETTPDPTTSVLQKHHLSYAEPLLSGNDTNAAKATVSFIFHTFSNACHKGILSKKK